MNPLFKFILAATLFICTVAHAAEAVKWDFEKEPVPWTPRVKSIELKREAGVGATGTSKGFLHIQGAMTGSYNYAISESQPMAAGSFYRLTAWVRVVKVGATTPMPFLKCEFIGVDGKTSLGRVNTSTYDHTKMGEWQQLSGEFQAPPGVAQCWLALEAGGNDAVEIDAYLDDVVLQQILKLTIPDTYNLKPVPMTLQKLRGVHPRLYLDAARVAQLRASIKTTHAALWAEVQSFADNVVKSGPPPYLEHDSYSGDEQLYQREVGNAMPYLAMAYILTNDVKYLDSARAWALASCAYPTWGLGHTDGKDLAAGHQLFGLAIIYDWCYEGLGEEARRTIRNTLAKRANAMYEAATLESIWWHKSYLQNHLWVSACGMAAAGFALYGEEPDATRWIGLPLAKFRTTMDSLGPDGASHEGFGYWEYGVEYMMKFMFLSRELLGIDLFANNLWWKNTALYAQYLSLPRQFWTKQSSTVDFADSPRYHWYGPDYLLRGLARQYHDGHAQWLAAQIDEANIDNPSARWLNLIWFDPTVSPQSPADLPTMHHFEDMGIVTGRTDWSGDESLLAFKCGPFIGHEALAKFSSDPGGGHVHPDANHFSLFGAGEWLIRDDGYQPKWTGQHNTLLIDGAGQYGEGKQWFDGGPALIAKAAPKIIRATSSPDLDIITGDATQAYPPERGLKRYVRHLLFLKPNILVVLDDIETNGEKTMELRFHPESKATEQIGRALLFHGKQAEWRFEALTTKPQELTTGEISEVSGDKESVGFYTLSLKKQTAKWRNAVAISWSKASVAPVPVTLQTSGERWLFKADNRMMTFDWKTSEVSFSHNR